MMLALLALKALLVVPFYIIYKPPHFVMDRFARRWPTCSGWSRGAERSWS
jgi:hypothetical protein